MRFSDFEVVGELGRGSYARVLRVLRRSDGAPFALKVQDKAFLLRERKAGAAALERELLVALAGAPGVVRLAFSFQDARSLYLATELCASDLFSQLRRRPRGMCAAWEAAVWFAQLGCALASVHAAGAAHGDVKPENVLLTAEGHVRLCDFGSAARLPAAPDSAAGAAGDPPPPPPPQRLAGTAEYCAPEVVGGAAATGASDLWALGVCLAQALGGVPPFRGPSEYLTLQAVLHAPLALPPGLPAGGAEAVGALLVRDPAGRPSINSLRSLPLLRDAPWDALWTCRTPEVLPEPTAEVLKEAREPSSAVPQATPAEPAPPAPTWALRPGERVVFSAPACRRRGARTAPGRLVATSGGRVALLPPTPVPAEGGAEAALLVASAPRPRRVDTTHVALCCDDGVDAFVACDAAGALLAALAQKADE